MSGGHHEGARNWFKAPIGYYQSMKENLQSWGKDYLTSPCQPRQRLPTTDITCLLKTWETEYGTQFLKLSPILPANTYNFKRPNKTAPVSSCCGCGTRGGQVNAGKAPCFYSSSGIDKNGGFGGAPPELQGIKEMLKNHSCNNDQKTCSRFKPMPEYSPNWLKIRKAVQALKGCGLFYRKENSGRNEVPRGTRPDRPKQSTKCRNGLKNKNIDPNMGASEGFEVGGSNYSLVNDRSTNESELKNRRLTTPRKSLTSPIDGIYGGRYTVNAKYVGNRQDGRLRGCNKVDGLNNKRGLKDKATQKTRLPEKFTTSQNGDVPGSIYSSGKSTSCNKNYQQTGDKSCGRDRSVRENNLFFYNQRDGRMYHSSQFTSTLLNSPEYKDLYGTENGENSRSGNNDVGQYAGDGPMSVSNYDVAKAQKAGPMMARQDRRTGKEKQSGSGVSRSLNKGAGGVGYSNITKAAIPDDGAGTGKFKPLEVVPKQGLDIPEDLIQKLYEDKNRSKSENGEDIQVQSMSQSAVTGKKNKRKKAAVKDANENYVIVRKGRNVNKNRTIHFKDESSGRMVDEPPKPEKLEFFKS